MQADDLGLRVMRHARAPHHAPGERLASWRLPYYYTRRTVKLFGVGLRQQGWQADACLLERPRPDIVAHGRGSRQRAVDRVGQRARLRTPRVTLAAYAREANQGGAIKYY